MNVRLILLALGLSVMTACASVEPEPCTAEWIDYKKDRILRSFASDNRALINDFRKLANAEGKISPLAAVSLLQKTDRIERFVETFQDDVVPSLESAFAQCSQSDKLVPALTEFLRDEGVSPAALDQIAPFIDAALQFRRNQQRDNTPL